jgi:hypothetical protein
MHHWHGGFNRFFTSESDEGEDRMTTLTEASRRKLPVLEFAQELGNCRACRM